MKDTKIHDTFRFDILHHAQSRIGDVRTVEGSIGRGRTPDLSRSTLARDAEKAAAPTGQQTTRTIASGQRLSSIKLDDRVIAWDELARV